MDTKKENKKNDDLPYLPLEIWMKIASSGSPQLWHDMTLAITGLGRYSLRSHVQQRMKAKFVKRMESLWYGGRRICWKLPNGTLHSPNDDQPAEIEYDNNGLEIYEEWYKDGTKHRENDHPASIEYYANGSKRYEEWYKDGKIHRENDHPAFIYYYENNGSKKYERWYKNNEWHRSVKDQPARIRYYENGSKKYEGWYIDGNIHRENDHPSEIWYYENGSKKYEWHKDGERYKKKDLSACMRYDKNGSKWVKMVEE